MPEAGILECAHPLETWPALSAKFRRYLTAATMLRTPGVHLRAAAKEPTKREGEAAANQPARPELTGLDKPVTAPGETRARSSYLCSRRRADNKPNYLESVAVARPREPRKLPVTRTRLPLEGRRERGFSPKVIARRADR